MKKFKEAISSRIQGEKELDYVKMDLMSRGLQGLFICDDKSGGEWVIIVTSNTVMDRLSKENPKLEMLKLKNAATFFGLLVKSGFDEAKERVNRVELDIARGIKEFYRLYPPYDLGDPLDLRNRAVKIK